MKLLHTFESHSKYHVIVFNNNEELAQVIWKNGELIDETIFDRIRFFSLDDFSWAQGKVNAYFVALFDNDKIIGLAKVGYFDLTAQNENTYSISFFSIDKEYRKQGLARMMCDELFKYAKSKGYEISTSTYTFVGKKFLQHLFNEYAKKYNVKFYDRSETDSLHDVERYYVPYKDTIIHQEEL